MCWSWSAVVVESNLSRVLVISTRGMELMRRFGLEASVRAGAADVDPTALVTPTLSSSDGVVMPLGYPSDDEAAAVSPTRPIVDAPVSSRAAVAGALPCVADGDGVLRPRSRRSAPKQRRDRGSCCR